MESAKGLLIKYREIILYLVVGGFTTVVSFGMYFVFAWGLSLSPVMASAAADGVAIAVAYPLNKILVFQKQSASRRKMLIESAVFFATRAAFLVLSAYMMRMTVEVWMWPETISRAGVTALVVALNYVASKFIVFKR